MATFLAGGVLRRKPKAVAKTGALLWRSNRVVGAFGRVRPVTVDRWVMRVGDDAEGDAVGLTHCMRIRGSSGKGPATCAAEHVILSGAAKHVQSAGGSLLMCCKRAPCRSVGLRLFCYKILYISRRLLNHTPIPTQKEWPEEISTISIRDKDSLKKLDGVSNKAYRQRQTQ